MAILAPSFVRMAFRGRFAAVVFVWSSTLTAQAIPQPQNPSPMVETTRAHERLSPVDLPGSTRSFPGPWGGTVHLFIPPGAGARPLDLLVHFHGPAWLVAQATAGICSPPVAVTVNVGAGSGRYEQAFSDPAAFDSLLTRTLAELGEGARAARSINLSAFSAGHGAVRAILRDPGHFSRIMRVLLLDGMHTSYEPEGVVLAAGGSLDATRLGALASFARGSVSSDKRMLITHSEIFPGTFASTTETADWLLGELGLTREAVLKWGPRGMQQLSEVRAGRFALLGFAGNTGVDHTDHLHALPELLSSLFEGKHCPGSPG